MTARAANKVASRVAARFGAGNSKIKGYAQGGSVDVDKQADLERSAGQTDFRSRLSRMRPLSDPHDALPSADAPGTRDHMNTATPAPSTELQLAKGGKIKRVAGKPIGKDDGLIAAQKGEFVMRKAAVKKYGEKKMAAVNRGAARVSVGKK